MSVAGGLPRAVERAIVHGCRGAADFREEREPVARARPAAGRDSCLSRCSEGFEHSAGRLTRELPDQPRVDKRRRFARNRWKRWATSSTARKSLGLLGVVLHPGCYTAGSEADGLELIADGARSICSATGDAGKTMVLLEHTAGQGTALGATFEQLASIIGKMNDHRARRRVPRHLSSARVRLRHRDARRLRARRSSSSDAWSASIGFARFT